MDNKVTFDCLYVCKVQPEHPEGSDLLPPCDKKLLDFSLQTFDGKLLAEPPEGVLLDVGQPSRILASAQVERHGIVFGKIGLLTQKQTLGIHTVQQIVILSSLQRTHLLPHSRLVHILGCSLWRTHTVRSVWRQRGGPDRQKCLPVTYC